MKGERDEKQGAGEKVLTSQNKKSIERHKVWLFHEECVYVWESRSSCGTHDWRDSYPRPHVSQSPPLPFCPTLPRSVLHRAVAAVKQPFWEQQTHEEVLVCQTSVLSITVRLQPCRVQKTQRSIHKSLASGGNRFSTHLLPRSLANALPSSHIPPYLSLKGRSHMQRSAAAKQPRAIDF